MSGLLQHLHGAHLSAHVDLWISKRKVSGLRVCLYLTPPYNHPSPQIYSKPFQSFSNVRDRRGGHIFSNDYEGLVSRHANTLAQHPCYNYNRPNPKLSNVECLDFKNVAKFAVCRVNAESLLLQVFPVLQRCTRQRAG